MKTTTSAKIYDPVGHCIYCGRVVPKVPRLTIEHIIPLSLGGLWELPAASCDDCADITKRFEQTIARDLMRPFRAKHKFKSRRKLPDEYPLTIVPFGEPAKEAKDWKTVTVSIPEHHGGFTLWAYPPPRLMRGMPEEQPPTFDAKPWHYPSIDQIARFHRPHGGQGFMIATSNFAAMAKLIAKIAHGYTVATLGNTFAPLLTDVILERSDNYFWLIGGELDPPAAGDELHEVSIERRDIDSVTYSICRIRLFSCLGAPIYYAVSGWMRPQ